MHAERFTVDAKVLCPASLQSTSTGLVANPAFTTRTVVPCSGLHVVAMDADPGWDENCGEGYTDSSGRVLFTAECSDNYPGGGPPDVYLKIEARSMLGFSVGTHDYGFLDGFRDALIIVGTLGGAGVGLTEAVASERVFNYLRSHETYVWETGEYPMADGATLTPFAATGLQIGGGFDGGGPVSLMAARQFWAVQYTMSRLRAGSQYRPMDFNYTIDAPIGSPTTLWDTVILDSDKISSAADYSLEQTAHEIGHVFYNTHHSDFDHWLTDARFYPSNHELCEDGHLLRFAWYEGFANFIRDYVFQRWDWATGAWTQYSLPADPRSTPYDGCFHSNSAQVDLHWEGNVQAFLNNIVFGPVNQQQLTNIGAPVPADATCPAGWDPVTDSRNAKTCERKHPASCPSGQRRLLDHGGAMDMCEVRAGSHMSQAMYNKLLRSTACQSGGDCPEPPEILNPTECSSGQSLRRRTGIDQCVESQRALTVTGEESPVPRIDGSRDRVLGFRSGTAKAWYVLPDLDDVVEWVIHAHGDSHTAKEFWNTEIGPWCGGTDPGGRSYYCNPVTSRSFAEEMKLLDPNLIAFLTQPGWYPQLVARGGLRSLFLVAAPQPQIRAVPPKPSAGTTSRPDPGARPTAATEIDLTPAVTQWFVNRIREFSANQVRKAPRLASLTAAGLSADNDVVEHMRTVNGERIGPLNVGRALPAIASPGQPTTDPAAEQSARAELRQRFHREPTPVEVAGQLRAFDAHVAQINDSLLARHDEIAAAYRRDGRFPRAAELPVLGIAAAPTIPNSAAIRAAFGTVLKQLIQSAAPPAMRPTSLRDSAPPKPVVR